MPLRSFTKIGIHKPSDQFITHLSCWEYTKSPIVLAFCQFDIHHYHPRLYDCYDISAPSTIQKSVSKRQAEFLAGRYAAKQALTHCIENGTSTDIAIGSKREPIWPNNIRGSLSHSTDTAIAVTSASPDIPYIGVDIENILPLKTMLEIAAQVYTPVELQLFKLHDFNEQQASTLIFSAKEALFKALYPYVNQYFGFEIATVRKVFAHQRLIILELERSFSTKFKLQTSYSCYFDLTKNNVLTLIL